VLEIIFRRILITVITIHQRYRRTDRQTTYYGNAALCVASRGKNRPLLSFVCHCVICCTFQSAHTQKVTTPVEELPSCFSFVDFSNTQ